MYGIVIPGKVGKLIVRFPSAAETLKKYREMEQAGERNIDVTDAKGEPVTVEDLEQGVKDAAAPVGGR